MKNQIKGFLQQKYPGLLKIIFKPKQLLDKIRESRRIPPIRKASAGISVCYLTANYPKQPPTRQEYASGGTVKMMYLAEAFPHSFPSANIFYAVSSVGQPLRTQIVAKAKEKGLKIIVNQNGVAYPAWHGSGWEITNQWLNATLKQADYIVYQSRFCQVGAEQFLAPPKVPWEVLHNPVDIALFTPTALSLKPKNLTLLLGGNQNQRYRLELALRIFKIVLQENPDARLIVTGGLWEPEDEALSWTKNFLQEHNLTEKVTFTGKYSQKRAPAIFSQAHILLHTQYNDASPTLVLEALASGLPVVYIDSGGVPELVADAGIGIPVEPSWEQINLPDPQDMAEAVLQIMSSYHVFSSAARAHAVSQFSLERFILKHRQIFEKALEA